MREMLLPCTDAGCKEQLKLISGIGHRTRPIDIRHPLQKRPLREARFYGHNSSSPTSLQVLGLDRLITTRLIDARTVHTASIEHHKSIYLIL